MEVRWNVFREVHVQAAMKVLGVRRKINKPWISRETLKSSTGEKETEGNTSRSPRIKSNLEAKYHLKDKEIKRLVRRDKGNALMILQQR